MTLDNAKIKTLMEKYLALIKTTQYAAIEQASVVSQRTFVTTQSRHLVKVMRNFANFGNHGAGDYESTNWYADNNIANTTINGSNFEVNSAVVANSIGQRWQVWIDSKADQYVITDAAKAAWLFSNCAKSIIAFRERLNNVELSKTSDFENGETSNNLQSNAKALATGTAFSGLVSAINNLLPESSSSVTSYQAMKFTKAKGASWTKTAGYTQLVALKEKLAAKVDLTNASAILIGDKLSNAMGLYIQTLDTALEDIATNQQSNLENIINSTHIDNTEGSNKGKLKMAVKQDIKVHLLQLNIHKTQLYHERSKSLKMLASFLRDSKVDLAYVERYATRLEQSTTVLGSIAKVIPVKTIQNVGAVFTALGTAAAAIKRSNATLPVTITQAQIDKLSNDVTRLKEFSDSITDGYKAAIEQFG